MRASCETDWLNSGMAPHVVAKWIGHSVDVQNRHYAQVDDHHFDQFNDAAEQSTLVSGGQEAGEKVVHQVFQKTPELARNKKRDVKIFAGFMLTQSYPAGTRTPTDRTRICCATNYTTG